MDVDIDNDNDIGNDRITSEDPLLQRAYDMLESPPALESVLHEMGEGAVNGVLRGRYDYTLLHWAVHRNLPDSVKVLLKHGADAHKSDLGGLSPLFYAVRRANVECIRLLVEHYDADAHPRLDDYLIDLLSTWQPDNTACTIQCAEALLAP